MIGHRLLSAVFRPALLVGIILFVLLSSCITKGRSVSSKGFHLDLATVVKINGNGVIEECSPIVVLARENQIATINMERLSLQELNSRLREILKSRSDKLVFVGADPKVSMQDLTAIIDAVYPEADVTSPCHSEIA